MISDIRLQHFRSYQDKTFQFTPGVNIIVGANASGKTNLLEAILVAALGSSYRAKDIELIAHGQPWARIDAHTGGQMAADLRTIKLLAEPAPGKSYEVEGRVYKRLPVARTLPIVMFEPNHLFMLSGPPDLRRSYLDELLEQISPSYARARRDYKRVLAQRNTLLKRLGPAAASQIFPWNIRLSELGGVLVGERIGLLESMNRDTSELYGSLAHKQTTVQLRYQSKLPADNYASGLLRLLDESFELDVARGFTGNGPHRDDMSVLINGHPSQTAASRGEARTAVLMLKVLELRLTEQSRGVRPLLLLDDVFSELDAARRRALTGYLQDYQTFITTTDADMLLEHFADQASVIRVAPVEPTL